MKQKFRNLYGKICLEVSQLSVAQRLKVGAIIIKDNRVISIGYNGTPSGWDNQCERLELSTNQLVTKDEVIHAEMNAIGKIAKSSDSCIDATIFTTHAPCMNCAKLIQVSGITRVVYLNKYRDDSGLNFLQNCGILVEKMDTQI